MPRKSSAALDYDAHLSVPVPDRVRAAIALAAARKLTSMNSYCREALLAQLAKDGVKLKQTEAVPQ